MNMRGLSLDPLASFVAAFLGIAVLWTATAASSATTVNTTAVPISITVNGSPESVTFTGTMSIRTRQVLDPVLGAPPMLEIIIDLGKVTGVGVTSGKGYAVSSPVILHRALKAIDLVEATFAYYPVGNINSAHTVIASCTCSFDLTTGAITATKLRFASL
jgi:hypothetical protein